MAAQFSRTTRSMARDSSAVAMVTWAVAALLLVVWLAWFVFGRVTVYEISRSARLEVQQAAHPVAVSTPGKVLGSHMTLGQEVHAGDVLLTLDASRETLRLEEEQSRLAAFAPRIASLNREISALKQAQAQDLQASEASVRSARLRTQEATAATDYARDNERRLKDESKAGGVAAVEAQRAAAETRKLGAARDAMASDALRAESDARTRFSQQQAQIEALERAIVTLEGEHATTRNSIARLAQEQEQLVLRAPVDGVLGEVLSLGNGAFVAAGQKIATVVPRGGLMIVANFPPSAVLGRIHPGQQARMRLDGFPWTAYGSLDAEVSLVASEIRDQTVRVELRPRPASNRRILLQHGLPGVVEISLEQTAPVLLLLRSIGQVSPDALLGAANADKPAP
jgi:membrane fusion protein (multidrug efflux system)